MVNLSNLIGLASLGLTLQERNEREERERRADAGRPPEAPDIPDTPRRDQRYPANDHLKELVEHERTNNPGPKDKDAFASAVIVLDQIGRAHV